MKIQFCKLVEGEPQVVAEAEVEETGEGASVTWTLEDPWVSELLAKTDFALLPGRLDPSIFEQWQLLPYLLQGSYFWAQSPDTDLPVPAWVTGYEPVDEDEEDDDEDWAEDEEWEEQDDEDVTDAPPPTD